MPIFTYALLFFTLLPIQTVPFCYHHMYRTLADPKRFGGLPDRRIAVNNIVGDADSPLLDIILQRNTPQESFLQCMKDS